MKKIACLLMSCLMLTGCQMFKNTEAIQEKVIDAAKSAVIKVAYAKIDKSEKLSDEGKEILKEITKKFIDNTFDRLREKYEKLSQKEIEDQLNPVVDDQIEAAASFGKFLKK